MPARRIRKCIENGRSPFLSFSHTVNYIADRGGGGQDKLNLIRQVRRQARPALDELLSRREPQNRRSRPFGSLRLEVKRAVPSVGGERGAEIQLLLCLSEQHGEQQFFNRKPPIVWDETSTPIPSHCDAPQSP